MSGIKTESAGRESREDFRSYSMGEGDVSKRIFRENGKDAGRRIWKFSGKSCQALRLNPSKVRVDGKNALQVLGEEKEE